MITTTITEEGAFMARHTTMPVRIQHTPYGDVRLTSRWMRDRYYLVATGAMEALRWMFPKRKGGMEQISPETYRLAMPPSPRAVTVERDLRRICSAWQERWDDLLADHVEGVVTTTGQTPVTTLGQLFDHLYAERLGQVATSTASRDKYRLKLWRDEMGEETPLGTLTPDFITKALKAIGRKTSPSTANTALGMLKTYLNWASDMGHLPTASHRTVKRLREAPGQRSRRDWWTADEVGLALRCAAQDHHQPTAILLVACGCFLGLRVEELVMLRWQDLELDLVDPSTGIPKPVCHLTPHDGWQPKDGEPRDIPIAAPLLRILREHLRTEGYLLQNEPGRQGRPRGGKGWIYRYDPKKCWLRIMTLVEKARGKRITMYGMRHSFASNLLIAGVSDVKVSRWLGHADTRMVHRHYGHLLSYDEDIDAITRGCSGLRIVKEVDKDIYLAGA